MIDICIHANATNSLEPGEAGDRPWIMDFVKRKGLNRFKDGKDVNTGNEIEGQTVPLSAKWKTTSFLLIARLGKC